MVCVSDFLNGVSAIKAESPTYRSGGDGSDGTCDCIGLVIGGIRRAGGKWPGKHGSNYTARFESESIIRNVMAEDLEVGWVVFKARGPMDQDYDLPDEYRLGGSSYTGDIMDYYHVGIVTSVEPLNITHCTKSDTENGIVIDTKQGKWTYASKLKMVKYVKEEECNPMDVTQATVTSADGNPVKLRPTPSTDKPYLAKVPVGTIVDVIQNASGWAQIKIPSGQIGYMMSQFLNFNNDVCEETDSYEKEVIDKLNGIQETLNAILDSITNG